MKKCQKEKKLKDYSIKTRIIIKEWRERIKTGAYYNQPFVFYSFEIKQSNGWSIASGGFKSKRELFRAMEKAFT
jgi:hypothetical protein